MNDLIARMTGQRVQEDVPVPVAAKARPRFMRDRDRRGIQRRTAAAMMGMAEASEDAIIPDEAEEIDDYGGPAGVKTDREAVDGDKSPEDAMTPDSSGSQDQGEGELITPNAALVAPDVTPSTLEPIDPSEVPAPKVAPAPPPVSAGPASKANINPLDVLLGRTKSASNEPLPPETPVTAEAAQASINTVLGVGTPGDLLGQGKEMPPPAQADSKKIMEAFYRFTRR